MVVDPLEPTPAAPQCRNRTRLQCVKTLRPRATFARHPRSQLLVRLPTEEKLPSANQPTQRRAGGFESRWVSSTSERCWIQEHPPR